MTATQYALGKLAPILALLPNLSRNTASGQGSWIDVQSYEGMAGFFLDSGAATAGSSPTLNVTFEESADQAVADPAVAIPAADFAEAADFTQVTSTASMQLRRFDVSKRKRYVRAVWAIGGTSTPAFPFGVGFIGQKQYA